MNDHEKLLLKQCPHCEKYYQDLRKWYDFLFDEFDANVVYCTSEKHWHQCEMIICVKGMKIFFNWSTRDYWVYVGPESTALSKYAPEWKPLHSMLNFIDNRSAEYHGPDAIDDRFATKEATKQSFERLIKFYSGGEYHRKIKNYDDWEETYKREFQERLNAWSANRRSSQEK